MSDLEESIYFAPLLPWQTQNWEHLSARYERLPHGLLFAGMSGIGKRAFVWRYVAWQLCENRLTNSHSGCGTCQSCQWLRAGTHPDLTVLPNDKLPVAEVVENNNLKSKIKPNKSANKTTSKDHSEAVKTSIKVDDIRNLQPFMTQGSTGRRICVIDDADMMTVAAANALLKTLEEPRHGVYLFLISDTPTKLLPTIKSRVQKIAIDHIAPDSVQDYLTTYIKDKALIDFDNDEKILMNHVSQSLKLANGAPLAALEILSSRWYSQRVTWLKTWLALRFAKRSSTAASDYWQKILTLKEFILLSEFILMDMSRYSLGIEPLQLDLDFDNYDSIKQLKLTAIQDVLYLIEDIKQSGQQNVQEKIGYDRVMSSLENL